MRMTTRNIVRYNKSKIDTNFLVLKSLLSKMGEKTCVKIQIKMALCCGLFVLLSICPKKESIVSRFLLSPSKIYLCVLLKDRGLVFA